MELVAGLGLHRDKNRTRECEKVLGVITRQRNADQSHRDPLPTAGWLEEKGQTVTRAVRLWRKWWEECRLARPLRKPVWQFLEHLITQ